MKLVSILCDFHIFGGAQNVAIQIAKSMSDGESYPIILTDTPKENIFKDSHVGVAGVDFYCPCYSCSGM